MLGFMLSLVLIFGLPGIALDRGTEDPWYAFIIFAVALVAIAWLVGVVFVRTVGIAAVGLVIGGVLAALLAPFAGNAAHIPGFLLMALAGVVIGNGQKVRMGGPV